MKKDIEFYNKESNFYFEKRYLGKIDNFIKYFFNKRLNLFLEFFRNELENSFKNKKIKILDIGCADGYVISEAYKIKPQKILKVIGEDISPRMIEKAKELFFEKNTFNFYLRDNKTEDKFDLIVELGVPISNWREEFEYVNKKLEIGGIYIFSTPGSKKSLYSLIKKDFHIEQPMSFNEFDSLVNDFFDIKDSQVYAFFVPKLWKFPKLALIIQPMIESIFSIIIPDLFHEKIYVLKKRT